MNQLRSSNHIWLKARPLLVAAFTVLAPSITVVGLGLSLYQAREARLQGVQVREIADAISTQYVGTFPDNIEPITDLIRTTTQSLWILTDYPAYGAYSRPAGYAKYRRAIEKFLNSSGDAKDFRILCYNQSARRTYTLEQLPEASWDRLQGERTFAEYYRHRKKPPASTFDRFLDDLEEEDHSFFRRLAELTEPGRGPLETLTNERLPVLIWLSDDREAIFSFFSPGADDREVSFRTNDPSLIAELRKIAANAFENAGDTPGG